MISTISVSNWPYRSSQEAIFRRMAFGFGWDHSQILQLEAIASMVFFFPVNLRDLECFGELTLTTNNPRGTCMKLQTEQVIHSTHFSLVSLLFLPYSPPIITSDFRIFESLDSLLIRLHYWRNPFVDLKIPSWGSRNSLRCEIAFLRFWGHGSISNKSKTPAIAISCDELGIFV